MVSKKSPRLTITHLPDLPSVNMSSCGDVAQGGEEICLSESTCDETISITLTTSGIISGPEELAGEYDIRLNYDASEKDTICTLEAPNAIMTPPTSCTLPSHFALDETRVSDFERTALPEFFRTSGSRHGAKTSTRYVYIRTRILQIYRQSFKGVRYMNKLAVRRELLPEIGGDSGCYSRVHEFLEGIGAINEGYINKRGIPKEKKFMYGAQVGSVRKRVLRNSDRYHGTFNNKTISHNGIGRRSVRTKAAKGGANFDPFSLVPLMNYPPGAGPFHVSVTKSVIMLMKMHAMLSDKEIIGLLGGHYHRSPLDFDTIPEESTLTISAAIPCQAMGSSGTECDMDPVSEMAACEKLATLGLTMVGWYHSHPHFEAHPSLRDIETQTSYQELFRNGDHEPFIGFIISPSEATIECVHVSQSFDMHASFRMPYRLSYETTNDGTDRAALQDLLLRYNCHQSLDDILNKLDDL